MWYYYQSVLFTLSLGSVSGLKFLDISVFPQIIEKWIIIFSQPTGTVTLETEDNQETSPQMSSLLSLDKFQYLNAPKLDEIITNDDFECMFRCLHHPLCVSVNLVAESELRCELLSPHENSNPIEYKENKNAHHSHFLVRDYLDL